MLIHSHEIIWCIRRTQYIPRFGGVLQVSGKYPNIFTSNIRCIGNSILGLVGVPHIRRLCGNTKVIRRVFADKLVVYSYYQDFTNQLKLENLGSSKT